MSDFSDVSDLGSDSEVGSTSDVNETNNDVDFGDGDGVNDFDNSDAQMPQEDFEYRENDTENKGPQEKEEMSSEDSAEQIENEFNDGSEIQQDSNVEQIDESADIAQTQEMSSDEYADSICANYESDIEVNSMDSSDSDVDNMKVNYTDNVSQAEPEQTDNNKQESNESQNDNISDAPDQDLNNNDIKSDEINDETNVDETVEQDNSDILDEQIDENEADQKIEEAENHSDNEETVETATKDSDVVNDGVGDDDNSESDNDDVSNNESGEKSTDTNDTTDVNAGEINFEETTEDTESESESDNAETSSTDDESGNEVSSEKEADGAENNSEEAVEDIENETESDNVEASGATGESGSEVGSEEATDGAENNSEETTEDTETVMNSDNTETSSTADESVSEVSSEEATEQNEADTESDNMEPSSTTGESGSEVSLEETTDGGENHSEEAIESTENKAESDYVEANPVDEANHEGEISEKNATDATNDTDNGGLSETKMSDGKDDSTDSSEKNAYFENTSYQQGQNEYGYLGTCGPTAISNSLNRVTGTSEYTENKVLGNAIDNDLCHKSDNPYSSGGTTTRDVVSIIDNVKEPESNIHTEVYEYDKALSVDELANRVDNPGTVAMVGVDSATLWDQRGDVSNSGLFNHSDAPSDHWITVDSPTRDDSGNVTGFNVIDSGGGVDYVDRDKFESMYMGDEGHTITDPTAIIISNKGDSVNTYSSEEGVERASNYKGSAVISDGGDPPFELSVQQVNNTEKTGSGAELTGEQKEINQYFRGDQFSKSDSFEGTIDLSKKEELTKANYSTTCEFNSNLSGSIDGNTKYSTKMSDAQIADIKELGELRESVPQITEDTVMQKVISPEQFEEYTREKDAKTQVSGCASRAIDAAPYTNNMEQAYETLRLDYNGTCFKELAENGGDMYVMRFTSDYCPDNDCFPKMDGSEPWNKPPCTGTGYTGSAEHLVPEYTYGRGQEITDGAIYKVDFNGNETMVGMWNHDRFEKVE